MSLPCDQNQFAASSSNRDRGGLCRLGDAVNELLTHSFGQAGVIAVVVQQRPPLADVARHDFSDKNVVIAAR
jgi:hypothetical protein